MIKTHSCFDRCGRRLTSILDLQRLLAGYILPLTVVCQPPRANWEQSGDTEYICWHGHSYYFHGRRRGGMTLNIDMKTVLLGMFCAGLDGRDTRPYVLAMDGDQCVAAHNLLKMMDDMLKAQWRLMGSPADKEIL